MTFTYDIGIDSKPIDKMQQLITCILRVTYSFSLFVEKKTIRLVNSGDEFWYCIINSVVIKYFITNHGTSWYNNW